MSTEPSERDAWAQRERLCFLDDEALVAAVDVARGFLQHETELVNYVQIIVAAMVTNPFEQPPEAIAQALLYLARHGIPHGIPTTSTD